MISTFGTELQRVIDDHRQDSKVRSAYLERDHSNYIKPKGGIGYLQPSRSNLLYASNSHSRIDFAKIVFEEMEMLHEELADFIVVQLTLTPRAYVVGEGHAGAFNPADFKRKISRYFPGSNMLGMIEAGYYPRLSVGSGEKGTVCFHAHLLGWTKDIRTLKEQAVVFRSKHRSLFPNRPSAYVQSVPYHDVPHVLWYHHKPTTHGYEVIGVMDDFVDPETGEVVCWLDEKARSHKRLLQRGERIRLDNATGDLLLDKLLVSTGDGNLLAKRIKRRALEAFNSSHLSRR